MSVRKSMTPRRQERQAAYWPKTVSADEREAPKIQFRRSGGTQVRCCSSGVERGHISPWSLVQIQPASIPFQVGLRLGHPGLGESLGICARQVAPLGNRSTPQARPCDAGPAHPEHASTRCPNAGPENSIGWCLSSSRKPLPSPTQDTQTEREGDGLHRRSDCRASGR